MERSLAKSGVMSVALFILSLAPVAVAQENQSDTYDVIIKNGKIIDGSGNPWVSGDVAIRGDRIAKIGKLNGTNAKRIIDAHNLVVAPGFIAILVQSQMALPTPIPSLTHLS